MLSFDYIDVIFSETQYYGYLVDIRLFIFLVLASTNTDEFLSVANLIYRTMVQNMTTISLPTIRRI